MAVDPEEVSGVAKAFEGLPGKSCRTLIKVRLSHIGPFIWLDEGLVRCARPDHNLRLRESVMRPQQTYVRHPGSLWRCTRLSNISFRALADEKIAWRSIPTACRCGLSWM